MELCWDQSAGVGAILDHSLAAYLGDGPADSSVLRVFRRVLESVNDIHAEGASHDPLTPQTIGLDDAGQPHIPSSSRPHESADTVAFGSAKYSAPEAFAGQDETSSCETVDCYVLGFIFYEILIGQRAFAAQFASFEQGPPLLWLKWHADQTKRARSLSELRPNLGHFARLIEGMMEKDPGKRFHSISRVLDAFSSVEAQTVYNVDPPAGPASSFKLRLDLLRNKLVFAAAWLGRRLGAFRNPGIVALIVLEVAIVIVAVLMHRAPHSRHARQPLPAASPRTTQSSAPVSVPVSPLPLWPERAQGQPPVLPNLEIQPPVPPTPESELQIESHLRSRARLFVDNLRPVALSPGVLFSEKITPGPHRLRFATHSNSFLKLPVQVGAGGAISLLGPPKARSLRYVLLACNTASAKLYGLPGARAGLPGQAYEPVPEEGRVIAKDQPVAVQLGEDAKSEVRLKPLPAGSIRIVLEPGEQSVLVPVAISANVPDAGIVINGEKLRRQLDKGVAVVRMHPGEYRIKLVHPEYQDSVEQDVVVSENEQEQQLQFALSPVTHQSASAANSLPPRNSPPGGTATVGGETVRAVGKITFNVRPESAQIICRREDESQTQNCANHQPCVLRAGAYEIIAKATGFETQTNHIAVGAGDDKPYQWKLEAIPSALNPADFFEDGQNWTVDAKGWWSHKQPGYSFLRANRGIFVFEVLKPSGLFGSKKVSLVVNYKGNDNRVLYTIDEHNLHRSERPPGIQKGDYSVAHESPSQADYRFTLELTADRVIIRNAAGKILDNLPLNNAASGKDGFSGKVKLRVLRSDYPPYLNARAQ